MNHMQNNPTNPILAQYPQLGDKTPFEKFEELTKKSKIIYASQANFPATGDPEILYVVPSGLSSGIYYWTSGNGYQSIAELLKLGNSASNAFPGNLGKSAYDHSIINSGNPHGTKAADIECEDSSLEDTVEEELLDSKTNLGNHISNTNNPHNTTAEQVGAGLPTIEISATLLAANWTGDGPYSQNLSVIGLKAATKGVIGLSSSATAEQRDAARKAILFAGATGLNTITIWLDGKIPTINIPIVIQVLG